MRAGVTQAVEVGYATSLQKVLGAFSVISSIAAETRVVSSTAQ